MKPSERVHLIRAISEALGNESWNLIDLTLKQFRLSWTNQWRGDDRKAYVIDMVSDAGDADLVELAKHLGVVTELQSAKSPSFWNDSVPRIFVSHLAKSKAKVAELKASLEDFGLAAFVAHEDIEPTAEWQSEIELALSTMDALVALLEPGFPESKWTDQELGVAIGRRVPIIPLKAGLDPYGLAGKYQALQVKGKMPEVVALQIIELLAAKPQVAAKISRALVEKLKSSHSWARSKELMSLIEKCGQFTPEVIAELQSAAKENSQVGGAWGVPERIEKIVAAHRG